MTRSTSTHLFLLTGLGLAATLGGCVDGNADAAMRIVANIAPDEGCSVDSSSNIFIDDGVIDTLTGQGYVFTPSVVNEIILGEDEVTGPKTIYVEGANVEISFFDTERFPAANFDAELLKFQVPTSGSIEPGGGTAAFSFEIVPLELIDAVAAVLGDRVPGEESPRTTLDITIQMFGTRGSNAIESKVFRYPVQICVDCLRVDNGSCAGLSSSFTPSVGGACNLYQDVNLDCCDNFTVCPAVKPEGT